MPFLKERLMKCFANIFFYYFALLVWADSPPSFIIITIPKSGSHLIKRIVHEILDQRPYFDVNTFVFYGSEKFRSYLDSEFNPADRFIMFHAEETPEIETYLEKYPNTKVILTVRNLRDIVVSFKDFLRFPFFDQYIFQSYSLSVDEWKLRYDNKQQLTDAMKYFFLFQQTNPQRFNLA